MAMILSTVDKNPIAYLYIGNLIKSQREGPDDKKSLLQSSAKRINAGERFMPHSHLNTKRNTSGTQEAWVVISGSIQVDIYDIDDSFLQSNVLFGGDCMVSFRGGHGIMVINDSLVYEFKNGPYFGKDADKRFI